LPHEFHQKKSKDQLMLLAKEDWHAMGHEAQFVVLCMGLALRDVAAVEFQEPGTPYPADMPEWVKASPWKTKDMHDVLEEWAKQLEEEDIEEDNNVGGSPKGKGKGKAKATLAARQGKRKAQESDEAPL
jgi:hypothetical protein